MNQRSRVINMIHYLVFILAIITGVIPLVSHAATYDLVWGTETSNGLNVECPYGSAMYKSSLLGFSSGWISGTIINCRSVSLPASVPGYLEFGYGYALDLNGYCPGGTIMYNSSLTGHYTGMGGSGSYAFDGNTNYCRSMTVVLTSGTGYLNFGAGYSMGLNGMCPYGSAMYSADVVGHWGGGYWIDGNNNYCRPITLEYTPSVVVVPTPTPTPTPSSPPTAPTISAIGSCITGVPQSYTVTSVSADPLTLLHYGIDWLGGTTISGWVPSTGWVLQGVPQTITGTWTTDGYHTFGMQAVDSNGNVSPWTYITIYCSSAASCPDICPINYHVAGSACVFNG